MNFISLTFILFLILVLVLCRIIPGKYTWLVLLTASYIFYGFYNIWLIALILLTTLISYICARLISKDCQTAVRKKKYMIFTLVFCLGLLFIFKYLNFFLENTFALINIIFSRTDYHKISIILPMGISFYIFQTLSYVIDVYKGKIEAEKHFGYYALYITFFPQLVAGPIERPADLFPQLKKINISTVDKDHILSGLFFLLSGYTKKVLIADFLAHFVELSYCNVSEKSGATLLFGTAFFAVQIYCDFSGYSDIAAGCAKLLGINLSSNFERPYTATSFKDFWHRWHISLTRWFTDYVYIPLGGNRKGIYRECINILITFALSGLWHGAKWTFVIWGILNGTFLIIERLTKERFSNRFSTLLLVGFGWIFFRAENLSDAFIIIRNIFTNFDIVAVSQDINASAAELTVCILLCLLVIALNHIPKFTLNDKNELDLTTLLIYFILIMAIIVSRFYVLSNYGDTHFIYFEF